MEMPEVNAFIEDDEIIYHDYADIAIAIFTLRTCRPSLLKMWNLSLYMNSSYS